MFLYIDSFSAPYVFFSVRNGDVVQRLHDNHGISYMKRSGIRRDMDSDPQIITWLFMYDYLP